MNLKRESFFINYPHSQRITWCNTQLLIGEGDSWHPLPLKHIDEGATSADRCEQNYKTQQWRSHDAAKTALHARLGQCWPEEKTRIRTIWKTVTFSWLKESEQDSSPTQTSTGSSISSVHIAAVKTWWVSSCASFTLRVLQHVCPHRRKHFC